MHASLAFTDFASPLFPVRFAISSSVCFSISKPRAFHCDFLEEGVGGRGVTNKFLGHSPWVPPKCFTVRYSVLSQGVPSYISRAYIN